MTTTPAKNRTLLVYARGLLVVVLLALGVWAASGLSVDNDPTRLLPLPADAGEGRVAAEIGKGSATRLLLLAIDAGDASRAVRLSRELRQALAGEPAIVRVDNGEWLADDLAWALPLRFSHSPAMDRAQFDRDALVVALRNAPRVPDGVDGAVVDRLRGHDPHRLSLDVLAAWQPARPPRRHEGVWVGSRDEALLQVRLRAGGFDARAQARTLATIRERFAALPGAVDADLTIGGSGGFSAGLSERLRTEAKPFAAVAGVGVLLLLLLTYRSPRALLVALLPLACAVAAGLLAVRVGFGQMHGVALVFALTSLFVVSTYPLPLLGQRRVGVPAVATIRRDWPRLGLAVTGNAIVCLSLFSLRADGLAQLAVFTVAGLLAAALALCGLRPSSWPPARRDVLSTPPLGALARALARVRPGIWPLVPVLVLAGMAMIVGQDRPWWQDDPATLAPLPTQWRDQDARLREELAAPDPRWRLVLTGADVEAVLRASEELAPRFDALVGQGALSDHGLPSRFQPSAELRRWRLAKLPPPATLRAALADAADRVGVDPAVFEPMVADSQRLFGAGAGDWLAEAFRASPAGDRYAAIMRQGGTGAWALVELSGLDDPAAVRAAIADQPDAYLVDVAQVVETMVAGFRQRVLAGWGVAIGTLLGVLVFVRGPAAMLRVLPVALLAVAATVSILRLAGIALDTCQLIALMLVANLGVNYALFLQQARTATAQARRLHALLVSVAMTVLVFGWLALSSLPMLRTIGLTVSIGAVLQFAMVLLMARPDPVDGQGAPG